ncbi:isochorismatase (plasmid) [Rhizobium sp. ACO-34A]|nr:cysteine hydrolase [Rhizobium sp. ACO-34A]ATN37100.1 isochorismatase [Rhizobium sp. ACO-34A]
MAEHDMKTFGSIAANPYSWPFDGVWSAQDTALLLLGFQNGMIAELSATAELEAAASLLDAAKSAGIAVVVARRGVDGAQDPLAARRRLLGDRVPDRHSPEWQISDRLALPEDTILVDLGGDNAFIRTGLEDELLRRGVRNLIVAGLPTEGMVHATQRAANDMGFECIAVADACKGTSDPRHTAQLRITTFGNGLFGAVAATADILAALKTSQE